MNGQLRKCDHCEEEENKIQRKENKKPEAGYGSGFEDYVETLHGSGQSL
ncbi:MAG: hypothetical protein ABI358_07075 [Ginsengibacter sp.]